MRAYYWRWVKTAFTHSVGVVDLWTGLLTALAGVIDHYWPQGQIMTAYGWQIAVWALAAVMFLRLLMAPYWMAKAAALQEHAHAVQNLKRDRWLQDAIFRIINGRWPTVGEKSLPQIRDDENALDWKDRLHASPEFSNVEKALRVVRQAARDGELGNL